jgi:hypothetical protein
MGQWTAMEGIISIVTPDRVKFSSVVLTSSKGTSVSFTNTPKLASKKSKHNEKGRFIVRFVGFSGLNKVYIPLKVISILLIRSVAFRVKVALVFSNWMYVLLFCGKISAINWSGIGGGGAVTIG